MTLILLITGIGIVIAVAVFFVLGVFRATTFPPGAAYEKRVLLSPAELSFYHSLVISAGTGKIVLAKVRIADLIQVKGFIQESDEWWRRFGPIAKKHIDFVICDAVSMAPLVLIELDDRSHTTDKAQKRDELVNRVIAEAGYPLIRIPVAAHGYDTRKLAVLLTQTIHSQTRAQKQAATNQTFITS